MTHIQLMSAELTEDDLDDVAGGCPQCILAAAAVAAAWVLINAGKSQGNDALRAKGQAQLAAAQAMAAAAGHH